MKNFIIGFEKQAGVKGKAVAATESALERFAKHPMVNHPLTKDLAQHAGKGAGVGAIAGAVNGSNDPNGSMIGGALRGGLIGGTMGAGFGAAKHSPSFI